MRRPDVFSALVLGAVVAAVPAAAAGPPAVPPAAVSPAPCMGPPAAPGDIAVEDDIARRITDPPLLRFVARLEQIEPAERAVVEGRVASAAPQSVVASDVAGNCAAADAPYAAVRAALVALRIWKINGDAVGRFADAANAALAAIARRDTLPPATIETALEPFDATLAALQTPAATTCTSPNADAAIATAVPLEYPNIGKVRGEGATVEVKVTLDSDGDVVSATTYHNSASIDEDGPQFAEQVLIAAAITRYTPEVHDCKPEAGSYLFKGVFTTRARRR